MGTVSVKIFKAPNPPGTIKGNLILFSWEGEEKVAYFDFGALDEAQRAWLAVQETFYSGDRNSAILRLTEQPGYQQSGGGPKPEWINEGS